MNVSILLNCRTRRNRASERMNERKSEHIIVKRNKEREEKRKKFDIRKGAFPFDDDVKKETGFFLSLSLSLSRSLSLAHHVWWLNNCDEIFPYQSSIELLRVSIIEAKVAARQKEDEVMISWKNGLSEERQRRRKDALKFDKIGHYIERKKKKAA